MASTTAESILIAALRDGRVSISKDTPLTRLNYYDGKFLRADDLRTEQRYLQSLVAASNRAFGSGIAHGLDVRFARETLQIGAGLAIDGAGRVLLLEEDFSIAVDELIERSRSASPTGSVGANAGFEDCERVVTDDVEDAMDSGREEYLVVVSHAEALCGEEDVYGALCEEACVTTTERRYWHEGVVLRAIPLGARLNLPDSRAVPLGPIHLRSRLASAFFRLERWQLASWISGEGMRAGGWCAGADSFGARDIPLALLARRSGRTVAFDMWTVRRERIEPSPWRYWQYRMSMRPLDAFVAQILQFQCQLAERATSDVPVDEGDPCVEEQKLIQDFAHHVAEFRRYYAFAAARIAGLPEAERTPGTGELAALPGGETGLLALDEKISAAARRLSGPTSRILIRHGIVELPPAGYLPVSPEQPLKLQVRRLLGAGVDLRFCIVPVGYVPTAVMEAQHVSRISLLRGLDDPDDRPLVEILVPGGELRRTEARPPDLYAAKLSILPSIALFFGHRRSSATLHAGTTVESSLQLEGAAGIEAEWESPVSFHAAVASEAEGEEKVAEVVDAVSGIRVRGTADAALDRIRAVERSYRESAASRGTFIYETDPSVVNRLTLVSHDADEYIAKRAGADLLGTASGATAISTFEPRSMKPRHRAVAAWGEFEAGADPFSLSAGGRTQVSLRIALAMAAASPAILDVQVRGELRIDTPGGFEGRFAKGSFRGSVTTFTVRGDASEGPETETLELAFDLLRQPAERGREAGLRVLLSVPGAPEGAGLELAARWDADEVDLSLATGLTEQKTGIAHMTLLRSAEGLGVGHPARVSANHGLRLLDAALGSTAEGFSARAARLLFPERTRPHDEVSIAAQRDWVAFRTARTEICEADLVRPVTAVPRRYALFHLRVDSADEAMRIHAALLEGNDRVIATRPIRGFGVCEFAAGDATLLSSVAQLQQAFGDTNPGNRWACAVIASSTAALGDGVDLAAERLAALQRALAPQTAEPGVNQVATRVPAALELQGSDGSIAIITHEAMTTTCHEVYVGLPDAGLERILHLVLKEGIAGAHTQKMMSLIGEVTFVKGTAEVVDNTFDPVRATWLPQRERLSLRGLALFVPERETEEVVAAARAQASKMLGGLDAEGVPVHVSRIPSEIPGGCIAASTLLVETRRSTEVNVVMMRGNEVIDMERRIAMRIAPDGRLTNPISDEEMRILGERTRRSARLSSLDRADDPRVNDVVRTVRAEFERRGLIRPGTDPRAGADLTFAQREALRNAGVSEGLVMILHDR